MILVAKLVRMKVVGPEGTLLRVLPPTTPAPPREYRPSSSINTSGLSSFGGAAWWFDLTRLLGGGCTILGPGLGKGTTGLGCSFCFAACVDMNLFSTASMVTSKLSSKAKSSPR